MFKVDFHTHSTASSDGGINATDYAEILANGTLDAVAITDHNSVATALSLHEKHGDKIIVGEEIMTSEGEIIGLYLESLVPPGLSAHETIKLIKQQNGLVYIPHPFETVRKGLSAATLDSIADHIDIMEVCNGRAVIQNRAAKAVLWARLNGVTGAASSDAHGVRGIGQTYTDLPEMPTRDNLMQLLDRSVLRTKRPGIRALLYPKYNRLKKRLGT